MQDDYLMIENRGVAPVQSFTLLGASTTQGDDKKSNPYLIGMFGSGAKQSIGLCLRNKIAPIIFCGNERLDFTTQPETIDDGLKRTEVSRILCNGEPLGFVVEYGQQDWDKIEYAMREFVSNAIDRSIRQAEHEYPAMPTACIQPWEHIVIRVVRHDEMQSRSGYTRVFVPLTPAVWQFERDLHKWFLHFRESKLLLEPILPKGGESRSLNNSNAACIYRRGVLVREVEHTRGKNSLFDYNLNNLQVDESRKVNDSTVTHEAGRALTGVKAEYLQILLQALTSNNPSDTLLWEMSFDQFTICPSWEMENVTAKKVEQFQAAFQTEFGVASGISTSIFCSTLQEASILQRRGYKPIVVTGAWYLALKRYGLRTVTDVLTTDEQAERTILPADQTCEAHIKETAYVWARLKALDLTEGKPAPDVRSFQEIMKDGSQIFGFYRMNENTIYLHRELAGEQLRKVAIEEIAHYITGAQDETRTFQDFAFRLAGQLI